MSERLNAERERDDDVAHIILGWDSRFGKRGSPTPLSPTQKMLAAKTLYKPGDAAANAVVTISVNEDRTRTDVAIQWPGLSPQEVIDKAIAALEAERSDLEKCPYHTPAGARP